MYGFAERLKTARKRAKLTQAQAAKTLPVHVKTWSRWERGEDMPSFITGCRIAQALKVHPLYLAGALELPLEGVQIAPEALEVLRLYRSLPPSEASLWRDTLRDLQRLKIPGIKTKT